MSPSSPALSAPPSAPPPGRTGRDWAADLSLFAFAVLFAAVSGPAIELPADLSAGWRVADQVVGALGCAAVFLRRRYPVVLATALLLTGSVAHYLTGPTLVAVFTVAASRPWRATAWTAAVAFAPLPVFLARVPGMSEARAGAAVTYFALLAGAFGWGLFRRSRTQLIASLRERAELAEAGAAASAERARLAVREEIAREMHDVLGHRLSLLGVHAGALEFHPGAAPEEVARAAGVIRENARAALTELREVIGVLREDAGGPAPGGAGGEGDRPQPTLARLPRLVAQARDAGEDVELTGPPVEALGDRAPGATVGRTAYRIAQESLTNARRHAPGAAVRVRVSGAPGAGLVVEVASAGPVPAAGSGPDAGGGSGGGRGLVGLGERVRLAGGTLTAGPDGAGFLVRAWLPWAEEAGADGAARTGA
ncbi:histidine kinase [Streptomyces sp. BI20]|uniref:histidine kinase n=1 Tax=Streptomyces sp. BI20 TaxID=3403460 RepID=UPI003C74C7E8